MIIDGNHPEFLLIPFKDYLDKKGKSIIQNAMINNL